jgi:hypothetical protein
MNVGNTAALGAALRAYHAEQRAQGTAIGWEEVVAGFAEPGPIATRPQAQSREIYDGLLRRHAHCEAETLADAAKCRS